MICINSRPSSGEGTMSSFFFKRACWLLLCVTVSGAAAGQLLPTQTGTAHPDPLPQPAPAPDPLGRDTPNGTIYGFLHAVQTGNYTTAARYLQMTNVKRASASAHGHSPKKLEGCDGPRIFRQPETDQHSAGDRRRGSLRTSSASALCPGDVDADLDLVSRSPIPEAS